MALKLTLVPTKHANAALFEASGAIDPNGMDALAEALDDAQARGLDHVVLDLAGVRYVNSTGFGLLVKHATRLAERGGGLSLLGVPKKVGIVMEMLGISEVFAATCEKRPGGFAA